jgi:hypothetical protein
MLHSSRTKRTYGCIQFCVLNSVNNNLNANTTHAESVVQSLLQHMNEFRIHGDGSDEFVEAQLDWDVFTTQMEFIYPLQGEERRDTVLMRNNLVNCRKVGSRG